MWLVGTSLSLADIVVFVIVHPAVVSILLDRQFGCIFSGNCVGEWIGMLGSTLQEVRQEV